MVRNGLIKCILLLKHYSCSVLIFCGPHLIFKLAIQPSVYSYTFFVSFLYYNILAVTLQARIDCKNMTWTYILIEIKEWYHDYSILC